MKKYNLLSIIIPAYNEEKTIGHILKLVVNSRLNIKKEIIVVNDGSIDDTRVMVRDFIKKNPKNKIYLVNKKNNGKGSAVKLGLSLARGQIVIIQDADLEYDPNDYQKCIQPIIDGECKVVYGSRVLEKTNKRYSHLSFFVGGKMITLFTNLLYGSRLTDETTCYKTFDVEIIKSIKIENDKFNWEPEVTAKILKEGIKIKEVPINYYPRTLKEGKKISWKDGIEAFYTLIRYRLK